MPIRFRCGYCDQLLAIATRKAGMETTCPECSYPLTVPTPEEAEAQKQRRAEKRRQASIVHSPSSPRSPSAKTTSLPRREVGGGSTETYAQATKITKPGRKPSGGHSPPSDDRPLFEKEIDELLGPSHALPQLERPAPAPTTGVDSRILDDSPSHIVLSGATATLLTVGVVVLMVLSFLAGYYAGR